MRKRNFYQIIKIFLILKYPLATKQHYIDGRTGISYTLQGDYYLPNFILPVEENKFIGIWERGGKGTHLLSAAIILIVIFIIKKMFTHK